MPHPMRGQHQIHFSREIFSERPECAVGIATIAAQWSALERMLAEGLGVSLFAHTRQEYEPEMILRLILNNIDSLNARLDVIDCILEIYVSRPLYEEFLTKLRPEIRRRAGERATIVHGRWGICPQLYPHDLILSPPYGGSVRYTPKCFKQTVDRIVATTRQIADFNSRVRDERAEQGPFPPTPPQAPSAPRREKSPSYLPKKPGKTP